MKNLILILAAMMAGSLFAEDDPASLFVQDAPTASNMGFMDEDEEPQLLQKKESPAPATVYMKIITDKVTIQNPTHVGFLDYTIR